MKKVHFTKEDFCSIERFHKDPSYDAISCDHYDQLEIWAMRRNTILFVVNHDENLSYTTIDKIDNIYTKDKVEYLTTSQGLDVRLDQLDWAALL